MKQIFLVITVFFASAYYLGAQTVREFVIEQLQAETTVYLVSCASPAHGVIVFRTAIIGLNITMSPPSALINVNHNRHRNEYVLCVEPTDRRYRITITHPEFVAIDFTVENVGAGQSQIYMLNPRQAANEPATTVQTTPTQEAAAAMPPIEGIMVPGANLTAKFAWLQRSADSHNTYIVEATANESIAPQVLHFSGAINITVVLRGDNTNRTIRLNRNGTMFTVGRNVTFVLDNNITLQGHNQNTGRLVTVSEGGIFKMNNGATITGNTTSGSGGGVYVSGAFEMNGGTISGNTSTASPFTEGGGGVHVKGRGSTFEMNGGIISGNTAVRGGGVYAGPTFTMRNGTITSNIANERGGGVFVPFNSSNFRKIGGTITGYSSDQTNGNVVKDSDGEVVARRGHAAWVGQWNHMGTDRRKETTAGPSVNLASGSADNWDQ